MHGAFGHVSSDCEKLSIDKLNNAAPSLSGFWPNILLPLTVSGKLVNVKNLIHAGQHISQHETLRNKSHKDLPWIETASKVFCSIKKHQSSTWQQVDYSKMSWF